MVQWELRVVLGVRWVGMWLVEKLVTEIRKCAAEIGRCFAERPGTLVIHLNPQNKQDPVRIEIGKLTLN